MAEIVETFADHIHVPVPRVEVTGAMEGPLQQSVVHHLIGLLRLNQVDMIHNNLNKMNKYLFATVDSRVNDIIIT